MTKTCRFPLRRILATLLALVMIFTSALTLAVPAYAKTTASTSAFTLSTGRKKLGTTTVPYTARSISKTYYITAGVTAKKVKIKVGGADAIAADAGMKLTAARKYQVQRIYFHVVVKNGDSEVLETDVYPSGTLVTPSASFKLPGVGLFKKKPTYEVTITPCLRNCSPSLKNFRNNTDAMFCTYTTYWIKY